MAAWTKEGFLAAMKLLLKEPNTLFDDMTKKMLDYPDLRNMIQHIVLYDITESEVTSWQIILIYNPQI